MQISSLTSGVTASAFSNDRFAKVKQSFDNLGAALDAGNLNDAKAALEQLQKNAPKRENASDSSNPIAKKMETLSKAIDSGDVDAAKAAYADIKKTMSQRPARPAGGAGRPSGPPPGGAKKTEDSSSASSSSSSNKVYDPMDANKDGNVTWAEKQAYLAKHPNTDTDKDGDTDRKPDASSSAKLDVLA